MEKFGDTLKRLRVNAGLKKNELAPKVGVSPAFLTMVEKGHKFPSTITLEKMVLCLGGELRINYYSTHRPDILAIMNDKKFAIEIKRFTQKSKPSSKSKKKLFKPAGKAELYERSRLKAPADT